MPAWLLILQAAVMPPPEDPRLHVADRCPESAAAGDIVVCGRRDSEYRLKPLPAGFETPGPPRAERSMLGGTGAVQTEHVEFNGVPSNRIMLRMKWKF